MMPCEPYPMKQGVCQTSVYDGRVSMTAVSWLSRAWSIGPMQERFEALVGSSVTPARVALLREAGVDLAARADAQKARPLNELEALSGNKHERNALMAS